MARPGVEAFVKCGTCQVPFTPSAPIPRTAKPECAECKEWRNNLPHASDAPASEPNDPRIRRPQPPAPIAFATSEALADVAERCWDCAQGPCSIALIPGEECPCSCGCVGTGVP